MMRLRCSWFVLGMAFSLGLQVISAQTGTAPSEIASTDTQPAPAIATPARISAIPEQSVPLEIAPQTDGTITGMLVDTPAQPVELVVNETPEPAPQYPMKLTLTLENGDTLSTLLEQLGVASPEAHQVITAIREHHNLRKLSVGQDIHVELGASPDNTQQPIVNAMEIPLSVISSLQVTRQETDDFLVKKLNADIERKPVYAAGKINSSLYETAAQQGIPASIIARVINAYSYDVDFQREIRNGDRIGLLYEKLQTEKGDNAGSGNILYAKLHTGNRTHVIYRFVDGSGDADFYNEKGESVRKGLLRTPVNGARITSRFGMRRHPILGYSKMHKGVDFGAPTGTPIYAAGDGKVTFASRKGGYGNYLMIQHSGTYSTAYGHIHRFASGIRSGKKVKQGQVVAYVGSTGRSTGPHLHYEVLKNGAHVNPSGVKFKAGNVLAGKELAEFKRHVSRVNATVAALSKDETKVAMLDEKKLKVTQ
ncbi:MAG: peptidoglycan DD-metalloendopeptidase family protein [Alphaproteobacteria bacterium]